jgi:hypothetical protein
MAAPADSRQYAGACSEAGTCSEAGACSEADTPDVAGFGMSWGWDLDLEQVLDVLTGPPPWMRADNDGEGLGSPASPTAAAAASFEDSDPELEETEYQAAKADGRVGEISLGAVAGRLAEWLPTGPGLAGWLAQTAPADLEDGALAGVAVSFRRLASWAAAGELAAVAQIASRSARTDRRAEADGSGRPDRITGDAAGQVSLALAMSFDGATAWADLGVVLKWRLRATGEALADGRIDLARARMIVRMTSSLSDTDARLVEAMILGRAGGLTLGQLHSALRRAVIKVDPRGAEKRREDAEKKAKVVLYPEDEGTATLAGYALPGVQAAVAMARITALAKSMKAAGTDGKIDQVRAQVFLSLLLGTLPYIPPADGDSPDGPPDGVPPNFPEDDEPDDDPPTDPDRPGGRRGRGRGLGDLCPGDSGGRNGAPAERAGASAGQAGASRTGSARRNRSPADPGHVQPAAGPGSMLRLTMPLATLANASGAPGQLSRLGVVTAEQARQIAASAARHQDTDWRIVVCDAAGEALAVGHVPRSRSPGGGACAELRLVGRVTLVVSTDQLDAIKRPADSALAETAQLDTTQPDTALAGILARAHRAAEQAAAQAADRGRADAEAGGCAHQLASPAYRPPPRVSELVKARDGTCRFGTCRRPADQCDLDHVQPFNQGGKTCTCNLGGQCRSHHQVKQDRRWSLTQPVPGTFRWTTAAGRSYTVRPDPVPV